MDATLFEKLKQIQALAEKGVGGEKENAARMLKHLLDKHSLTMDDLQQRIKVEERVPHDFQYRNSAEKAILMQLYARLSGNNEVRYWKGRNYLTFALTESENERLREEYRIFRKAWKEEVQLLLNAFIQKHELFAPSTGDCPKNDIDLVMLWKLWAMADTISDVNIPVPKERQLHGNRLAIQ